MTSENLLAGSSKALFFSLIFSLSLTSAFVLDAQSPSGFNFQAVARDAENALIKNTDISVIAGIRFGSETGALLWEETHSVSTNEFGLVNMIICGDETLKTGGLLSTPGEIEWSSGDHYLDLTIKAGNEEVALGAHQLLPVPYSLSATGLSQSLKSLSVQGDTDLPEGEALFIVKRKDGYPVFAVYEDGVWVYTDTATNKGVKGGFAVGGYRKTAKGESQDYMRVTPDSVRFYIDQEDGITKGVKGGFAVGGYSKTAKGQARNFLDLSPDNYFIGHDAGVKNTTGLYNSFLGYQSGMSNTQGESNIFVGYQSGISNTLGKFNTFVGFMAGFSNIGLDPVGGVPQLGRYNCYVGFQAGYSSLYGDNNTMLGYNAGKDNTASRNTFIGSNAGLKNTEGSYNTFMGVSAGVQNLTGGHNIFIGHQAGHSNIDGGGNVSIGTVTGAGLKSGNNNVIIGSGAGSAEVYSGTGTGSSNVIIGHDAGKFAIDGSFNVLIGNQAGLNETESNKLIIANSETTQPLIWGDFEANQMVINGNAVNNPEGMTLFVNGPSGGLQAWSTPSDERLKQDIEPIADALDRVIALQGVSFSWKDDERREAGKQIGFVAQQAESVIPELVSNNGNRYSMQYAPITALLVEAIKEQQEIISRKEAEMDELKARLDRLEELVMRGK